MQRSTGRTSPHRLVRPTEAHLRSADVLRSPLPALAIVASSAWSGAGGAERGPRARPQTPIGAGVARTDAGRAQRQDPHPR